MNDHGLSPELGGKSRPVAPLDVTRLSARQLHNLMQYMRDGCPDFGPPARLKDMFINTDRPTRSFFRPFIYHNVWIEKDGIMHHMGSVDKIRELFSRGDGEFRLEIETQWISHEVSWRIP